MIHTVKGFSIVNEAEVDVFLEFFCVFNGPADVGNLISGSSAFSKSSLNIWKFSVHILLKPSLKNFEHYFASVWDECNCEVDKFVQTIEKEVILSKCFFEHCVVWTFFGIAFLWDWNENLYQLSSLKKNRVIQLKESGKKELEIKLKIKK